jgi:hypothetical protein
MKLGTEVWHVKGGQEPAVREESRVTKSTGNEANTYLFGMKVNLYETIGLLVVQSFVHFINTRTALNCQEFTAWQVWQVYLLPRPIKIIRGGDDGCVA